MGEQPPLQDRESLEKLCRKVAVSRTVLRHYREDWRRPAQERSLQHEEWSLLILVLGFQALGDAPERGLAFKGLNAAFQALDLARGAAHPELEDWLKRILDHVFQDHALDRAGH